MNAIEYLQSIPEKDRKAIGQCIVIAYNAGHKELALTAAEHIIGMTKFLGEESDRLQAAIDDLDKQLARFDDANK